MLLKRSRAWFQHHGTNTPRESESPVILALLHIPHSPALCLDEALLDYLSSYGFHRKAVLS